MCGGEPGANDQPKILLSQRPPGFLVYPKRDFLEPHLYLVLPFGITASVGVARLPLKSVSVLGCETIDDLIALADAAMYDAKRSGGNQIREGTAT